MPILNKESLMGPNDLPTLQVVDSIFDSRFNVIDACSGFSYCYVDGIGFTI